MEKLQLNDDASFFFTRKFRTLGFGFRCGFLGMLHMEIIQERLEREFNMTVITTVPNVSYHAFTKKDPTTVLIVNNPSDLPEPSRLDHVEEPLSRLRSLQKLIMLVCNESMYRKTWADYQPNLFDN
jgi:GTP-binding protein LepA